MNANRRDWARQTAKSMLAGGLYYSGILAGLLVLRRALGHPRVHVFCFHRVVPDFQTAAARAIPALCISTTTFDAQLDYLASRMDIVDLPRALEILAGQRRARRDAAVLTFDDGYRDTYTQAFPRLRRRGLPAVVFVPTGYVGTEKRLPHDRLYAALRVAAAQPPAPAQPFAQRWAEIARRSGAPLAVETAARTLAAGRVEELVEALEAAYGPGEPPDPDGLPLDWKMCAEMAAAGIEIGTHTVSHAPLGHEPPASLRHELAESKAAIERALRRPARFLAYPNGVYSDEVVRMCHQLGFRAALTTCARPNRVGADPMRLGRKVLWEAHGRGFAGRPSTATLASHLQNVYGEIGRTGASGWVGAGASGDGVSQKEWV